MNNETRRSTDTWAGLVSAFFQWVDDRDADKHFVSLVVLAGTIQITLWAERFAETGNRPGLEVAAIIAAVFAPYMVIQTAAINYYFKARA